VQRDLLTVLVLVLSNFPAKMFFVDTPPSRGCFVVGTSAALGLVVPWFVETDEMEEGDVAGEMSVCRGVLIIRGWGDVVGE
jgi:hypothetical protein